MLLREIWLKSERFLENCDRTENPSLDRTSLYQISGFCSIYVVIVAGSCGAAWAAAGSL